MRGRSTSPLVIIDDHENDGYEEKHRGDCECRPRARMVVSNEIREDGFVLVRGLFPMFNRTAEKVAMRPNTVARSRHRLAHAS